MSEVELLPSILRRADKFLDGYVGVLPTMTMERRRNTGIKTSGADAKPSKFCRNGRMVRLAPVDASKLRQPEMVKCVEECIVCLEEYSCDMLSRSNFFADIECKHDVCKGCWSEWSRRQKVAGSEASCPVCRGKEC